MGKLKVQAGIIGRQYEIIKDHVSEKAADYLPPGTIVTLNSIMGSTHHFTYVSEGTLRKCQKISYMKDLKLVDGK